MKKVFAVMSTLLLTIACIGLLSSKLNAASALFTDPVEAGALEEDEIPVYIMDSIYTTFPQFYDNNAKADEYWPGSVRMYPWNEVKLRVAQFDEAGNPTGKYYAVFFSGGLNATDLGAGNNIMILDANVAEDGTVTAVSKRTNPYTTGGIADADHPQDQSLSHIAVNVSEYDLEYQPRALYTSTSTSIGYKSQILNRSLVFDGEGRAIRGVGVNEFYVSPEDSTYIGYGFEAEFCRVNGEVTRMGEGVTCDKVKEAQVDEDGNPVLDPETGEPLYTVTDKDDLYYERFVWEWFEEKPEVNEVNYLTAGWDPEKWDYAWEQDGGWMAIAFNGSAGTEDSMTAAQKAAWAADNGYTLDDAGNAFDADKNAVAVPLRTCISYLRVPAGGCIYDFGYLDNGKENATPAFFNMMYSGYKYGRMENMGKVKTVNFSAKPIYTNEIVENGQSLQLKENTSVYEVVAGTVITPSTLFEYEGLAKAYQVQDDVLSYSSDTSVLAVTVSLNGAKVVSPSEWKYNDSTVEAMMRDFFDDLRQFYAGTLTLEGVNDPETGEPKVFAYSGGNSYEGSTDDLDTFITTWTGSIKDSWGLFNGGNDRTKSGFLNQPEIQDKWELFLNYMNDLMNGSFWASAYTSYARIRDYYQGKAASFPNARNGATVDKTPQVATESSYNFTVGEAPSRYYVEYNVVNTVTGVEDTLGVTFIVVNEYTPIIEINNDALIVVPNIVDGRAKADPIDPYSLFTAYDAKYNASTGDIRGTVVTEMATVTSDTLDFANPKEGYHKVTIVVKSLGGTRETTKTVTVKVEDLTAPIVVASSSINVPYGSTFDVRNGIQVAYDEVDGDLMQSGVQWWADVSNNQVNTTKPGKYTVKVLVVDSSGNETQIAYTANVIAPLSIDDIEELLDEKLGILEDIDLGIDEVLEGVEDLAGSVENLGSALEGAQEALEAAIADLGSALGEAKEALEAAIDEAANNAQEQIDGVKTQVEGVQAGVAGVQAGVEEEAEGLNALIAALQAEVAGIKEEMQSGCKSKKLFFVEFLAVAGVIALVLRKKH